MFSVFALHLASAAFVVTAYATGCDTLPGALTKSGVPPVVGLTVAADPAVIPLGSVVHIEGFGERVVHDVGGAVRGRHLDVFVASCGEARRFGKQRRQVRVLRSPRARRRR
jgi:3D (Asp-Asp-Asp) domain-containing protein